MEPSVIEMRVIYTNNNEEKISEISDLYVDSDWIAVEKTDGNCFAISKKEIKKATFGVVDKQIWYWKAVMEYITIAILIAILILAIILGVYTGSSVSSDNTGIK